MKLEYNPTRLERIIGWSWGAGRPVEEIAGLVIELSKLYGQESKDLASAGAYDNALRVKEKEIAGFTDFIMRAGTSQIKTPFPLSIDLAKAHLSAAKFAYHLGDRYTEIKHALEAEQILWSFYKQNRLKDVKEFKDYCFAVMILGKEENKDIVSKFAEEEGTPDYDTIKERDDIMGGEVSHRIALLRESMRDRDYPSQRTGTCDRNK